MSSELIQRVTKGLNGAGKEVVAVARVGDTVAVVLCRFKRDPDEYVTGVVVDDLGEQLPNGWASGRYTRDIRKALESFKLRTQEQLRQRSSSSNQEESER